MDVQDGFEARCARAIDELQGQAGLDVSTVDASDDAPPLDDPNEAFEDIAALTGIELPESPFREYIFAAGSIRASWNTKTEPHMVGEFCLTNIYRCLTEELPGLDDVTLSPSENEILAGLRVIDEEPQAGSGRLTGLLVTPGSTRHQVWLYDMSQERLELLDVDYGAYLENVLITKGSYGWQYLFADVDLNEPGLGDIKTSLTTMLDTFPVMFPDHSYADLRARLEARL